MRSLIGFSLILFFGTVVQSEAAKKEVVAITAEEYEMISRQVAKEVEKQVKKRVTPLILAESLLMPFPPVAPTKSTSEIKKEAEKIVLERVNKKFPLTQTKIEEAKAHKRYFIYKIGDMIPETRIRNAGRGAVIKGEFKGLNRKGELLVGESVVAKVDMKDALMVHFDPALNSKKIKALVANKLYYFYEDRKVMTKKITPAVQKEIFMASGYFMEGKSFMPAAQYLKKYYIQQQEQMTKLLSISIADSLFGRYGFVRNDKTWKKGKYSEAEVADWDRKDEPLFDAKFYDRDF